MLFECLHCRRQKEISSGEGITHGYCTYCYILSAECNGGIDWRKMTQEEREELKKDILPQLDRTENLTGEAKVVWPEEAIKFVDELIREAKNDAKRESELHDGFRR